MSDVDTLQRGVGEWGAHTFPHATNESITRHFVEEVHELVDAAYERNGVTEEAADCFLILLHLAHRDGFSLYDAAVAKFAVNKARTWETDDNGRGYRKHVEDVPA